MSKRFTQVKLDAFKEIQVEAGVILKSFNPANPVLNRADIICVTSGGVTVNCKPTYNDYFSDVDNVPNNSKEGKQIDGWECSFSATVLDTSPEAIKLELGAADIDASDSTRVTPVRDLRLSDFIPSLWWVGDRADGGFVAVQILNALSTDGFALKTTKSGKGTTTLTLTGHSSVDAVDTVPMVFYSVEGSSDSPSIVLDKSSATVEKGNTVAITATTVPVSATVTWQSLNTSVATVSDGTVTGVDEGTTTIVASFNEDDMSYVALCVVTVTAPEEQGEG